MSLESSKQRTEKESYVDDVQTYRLESGVTVEVSSRVFENEENSDKSSAIVFLPGWAMGAQAKSIDALCKNFAQESHEDVHALTTRSEERGGNDEHPDLLYEEARALKGYIELHGLKNITLAGHSQGGDKAINLASLLQNDPNIMIDGLVLFDPVGLYEQGGVELAATFTKHAVVDTLPSALKFSEKKKAILSTLDAGNDVVAGIAKEAWRSKTAYPNRFMSEISEMAGKNPYAQELHIPIVLVTGLKDSVSDAERIAPSVEIDSIKRDLGGVNREDATEENPARDTTLASREKYLQENLFTGSPYVRMLVPEKLGVHNLPLMRPESVAKTALYMLDRYKRTATAE